MSEPESLILQILREMRAELATKADLAQVAESVRTEVADLRSEVVEVKSDMLTVRKELGEQIVGRRRAVIDYPPVIGHGVIISELEAPVRRVEQHLNLPSLSPT
jgi:hypothetical protein